MEKILETITLSKALSVFLFLASIWLIRIIIKKEKHNLFRGMLFFLFLLLAFLYVNENDNNRLTLNGLRNQFFPPKPLELNYRTSTIGMATYEISIYIFDEPRPSIKLFLDKKGEYFHITNPEPVNRILKQLGLPLVKKGAAELASLTGSRFHRFQYRWPDYPLGILTLEKTRCQNLDTLNFYDCVIKISISPGH